jgi:nucleoside-diphosphate-sugar epimerase
MRWTAPNGSRSCARAQSTDPSSTPTWCASGTWSARSPARSLALPAGGTQLFHRVALDRVGRAVAAALERAPAGTWACNVADPHIPSFAAIAALVAERLGWEWEPEEVAWADGDHPWNVRHPIVADTTRLREILSVREPDPLDATLAQIDWLWEHRAALAALPAR